MKITREQFAKIEKYLPKQHGNVSINNYELVLALLYMVENGCIWRALPEKYGRWHTVYTRMDRWSKNGVLARLFEAMQEEGIIKVRMDVVCMDSTTVKVHPNGTGARKKNGRQILKDVPGIGRSRGGLSTKIHLVAADDHTVIGFSLSGGEAHDVPEGRKLLEKVQTKKGKRILVPDKAYEGDETREKTRGNTIKYLGLA